MTKCPEEVDPEKAPGVAAMQAMKFEEDNPDGGLNLIFFNLVFPGPKNLKQLPVLHFIHEQ